jgi:hypothetical protein
MKSRPGSFLYFSMGAVALMAVACSSGGGGTGTGGSGGGAADTLPPADNLISNFEDTVAVVVAAGTPPRNGYWYPYNDMSTGCTQKYDMEDPTMPGSGVKVKYTPEVPSSVPGNGSGSTLALHAQWTGCGTWGAGVGCDLNQPPAVDGGIYMGPKVEYDISAYKGIVFWAMATPGADTHMRIKVNMSDETKIADGGKCDETQADIGTNKCSDAWGQLFSLPTNGSWAKITVNFSDNTKFKQEGWGHVFPWNPAHAVSIQIQSSDTAESYDFWVDDMYFTN